jgi:hypothetical protein
LISENQSTIDFNMVPQGRPESRAVEDIVSEDKGDRLVTDKLLPDDECLGETIGRWLNSVVESNTERASVSEQGLELAVESRVFPPS